jgi:hypothetical protein
LLESGTMKVAVAGVLLTGCAYQANTFQSGEQRFEGRKTTVGCLDLAMARRADLEDRAVVAYAFGNRCEEPAIVDLATALVIGRTADKAVPLTPFDPLHEIIPLQLDGRGVGGEAIAYSGDPPQDICVDPGSIAHAGISTWVCLGQTEETP